MSITLHRFLQKKAGGYPPGIRISLVALSLSLIGWLIQAYSLIDWEGAVKLGLRNGSFSGDAVDRALATPHSPGCPFGILKKSFVGFVASKMEFAICIYFPLFYIFQMWETHRETAMGAVMLWGIPSIQGILGLWANRQLFQKQTV